ncbi:HAD-superfamily phosphatase, subfamily IIIC/FkbH-like domain-containing protein [Streptomyces sp. yr375]|uniref:type I polyketide synthase n=1 Tax=Streptomyces sp. yr375 TaxID=1761906 RepID=UPI0008D265ED|nr:type I polyketide synthase [Streptomyces sp. yr375]SES04630.1 HAD-superfamily phosphatase, subfamily IIIC/FkbH-like domain-containing protein [Streptomyces sp. yr375]
MSAPEARTPSPAPTPTTAEDVSGWLAAAVAEQAALHPDAVDLDRPIAELGLGSRQLVTLAAGLSELLGRPLDPSLLYNHPTIAAIAEAVFDDGPAGAEVGVRAGMRSAQAGGASVVADDIAIVSMACRFPGGADDPERLWGLLAAGVDVISEAPVGRWDTRGLYDPDPEATGKAYSLRGGYLADVDGFDAAFFGISAREAAAMDPQQRLLLQTSWEAIERAGIVPETLNGSSTGVYVGLYDSGYLAAAGLDQLDGHVGTGSASSVASGRIAYTLGLQGPAVTVDTACSSSLVALHLAARALAAGECDLALAGGASLLVSARGHVEFSRLRGLSPSGRCSPFSTDADGVVWAEGCGLVLLKRLGDARRDGDRVLAVVKGSAINQDGRSQGLSAPNGLAQERVLRAALDAAGLAPDDVDYVEAHGTGTKLGDPIEGRALAAVFGPGRSAQLPLGVGSMKSNLGHTGAAAGIGGVIKTVLALGKESLPPSLHAETPTDHVDWANSGLRVQSCAQPWPRDEARVRRAGVSAFGISGTNAHVVLEEAPQDLAEADQPVAGAGEPAVGEQPGTPPPAAFLFPLSARTLPALRGQAARLRDALAAEPRPSLPAVAATLGRRRTHFEQRAVVQAAHADELLAALNDLAEARSDTGSESVVGPGRVLPPGKVAFVFPGQGSQWAGMARDLLDRSPVFADELDRCDAALRPFTGWSVTRVLRGDAAAPPLDRVDVVQPVLFAVMVSLAAVWRSRGVRPDAVIGHSQGEVAAACVAGALSLSDAAAVVALRSQALTGLAGTGTMAVVALPHDEVTALLAEFGGRVSVAAVNSGRSTVIAGAVEPLEALLADLDRQQVFVRRIDVDYASHSAQVEPVRETLLAELDGVLTTPTPVAWYSTVSGEPVTEELEADYWYRNLREPVRFAPTVERMIADGHNCFVELSPHPALLTALRTIAEDAADAADAVDAQSADRELVVVGSLRRDEDGSACLDRAAAELHVHGRPVDWRRLVADGPAANLPTYAFQHTRYWLDATAAGGPNVTGAGLEDTGHALLTAAAMVAGTEQCLLSGLLSAETQPWLTDHTVHGEVLLPGTAFAEMAIRAGDRVGCPVVEELTLHTPLRLAPGDAVRIQVWAEAPDPDGRRALTVSSCPDTPDRARTWTRHASGTLAPAAVSETATDDLRQWPPSDALPVPVDDLYDRFRAAGYGYGPAFQGVRSVWRSGDGDLYAEVALPEQVDGVDRFGLHPALLDAALHALRVGHHDDDTRVMLPFSWSGVRLHATGATRLRLRLRRTGPDEIDLLAADPTGAPVLTADALTLRELTTDGPLPARLDSLYEVKWTAVQPAAPEEAAAPDTTASAATVLTSPTLTEALSAVQSCLAADTRLLLVTRGAVTTGPGDRAPDPAQAAVWGLVRSAQSEHPGRFVLVDVDDDEQGAAESALAAALATGEPQLAVRGGELFAPRMAALSGRGMLVPPADGSSSWRLQATGGASPDALALVPYETADRPLAAHEVRIAVRAAGLSLHDVAITLAEAETEAGAEDGQDTALGREAAGIVTETGPDVTDLAPGDRVMGLVPAHAFAPSAVADHRTLAPIPVGWTFARAASVPLAYLTAYHGLVDVAGLRAGESVRIHAADDGVGTAAAQLARHLGAEPRLVSSRTPADGGRLVELGVADVLEASPERVREMLAEVLRLFGEGVLTPLPLAVWDVRGAPEAFRHANRAGRFGKVVLTIPAALDPRGTVLITGATGTLGRLTARHLVTRHGVRHLLLVGRRGAAADGMPELTTELSALGATVSVVAGDVADRDAVAAILAGIPGDHPLTAVFHAAGVLDDGVIEHLTPDRLAAVTGPKSDAALVLHELTAGLDLAQFVLFSSLAGVIGNAGQANYAAANAALDALAQRRRAAGLPALSLAWGLWAPTGGMTGHLGEAELRRLARAGTGALTAEEGLALLDSALDTGLAAVIPVKLDTSRFTGPAVPPLLRGLAPAPAPVRRTAHTDQPTEGTLVDRLDRLPEPERAEQIMALVREEVSGVLELGTADPVRPDLPLRELGLDSLLAVELRNRLSARLGRKLPATLLFDHPTPARLAQYLLGTLPATASHAVRPRTTTHAPPAVGTAASATTTDEPVAVVSMACRLPGGVSDPDGLWRLVAEGRDAVGPFPAERWDVDTLYDPDPDALGKSYGQEGGFLDGIESFDAAFFGITPKEAAAMDPQQRLLLETAWEALERAGIVPADLAGSTTGVYIGMFGSEYLAGSRLDQFNGYVGTGSALSVASGRLAYSLGLHGPALTVDTACSSSLVALHLAAQALRSGECDLALTGGVTLMVTPQIFVEFSRLRGLSPSGRCRSFSDEADGAVWGEGVGMIVLKRLSDARRDGDEVLAVLRGTAVNQDGRSQGLSAPYGPAQVQVIRRALEQSGLTPDDIDFVEAHGTGTTLGDPIEANALAEVFDSDLRESRPLYVGSLKSNIGHIQAASGVAGLIKVVESLRHETLPRTLHADTPSRHVDWEQSGLRLLQEPAAWPAEAVAEGGRVRRAGLSAFGISGTNAHVIVEEAPPAAPASESATEPGSAPGSAPGLFVLSARSDTALQAQAGRLAEHVTVAGAELPLADVAFTLARHRSGFARRAAVVAADRDELLAGLEALANRQAQLASPRDDMTGKVAYVFSGHGGQWAGMALELAADSKVFRAELDRIDEAVRRQAGWSVVDVLGSAQAEADFDRAFGRTEVLQPVLFAVNAALAAVWRALGVAPDAVVGHSLGEIAAAYAAGALSLDDAVAVVTRRAAAVAPLVGQGGMLALDRPRAEVAELLRPYEGRLFVGAVNSPDSTAVSGDVDALAELRRSCEERGVKVHGLSTPFASHSPHMAAVRTELTAALADVTASRAHTPLYSSVLAEPVPGDLLDADYWYANLSEPVRFADTVRRLLDDGYRYFVELSPHPSLAASIEAVAAAAGVDAVTVGSLRRDGGSLPDLLRQTGRLYTAGHTPDWSVMFPTGHRADLPTYPFAPERHWTDLAPALTAGSSGAPLVDTHVEPSDEPDRHVFQTVIDLRDARFGYLADHRVSGEVWLPAAAFLEMALEAAATLQDGGELRLADVGFMEPLRLDADRPVQLQLILRPEKAEKAEAAETGQDGLRGFTIASRPSAPAGVRRPGPWTPHVTGRVGPAPADSPTTTADLADFPGLAPAALREQCADSVETSAVYARFTAAGLDYGPAFRRLLDGRAAPRQALARLAERPLDGHLVHPALLDAAFHVMALPGDTPSGRPFVPAGFERLRFTGLGTAPVWTACRLRAVDGDSVTLDVSLLDKEERPVLEIEGFRLASLSPLDHALFEVRWQPRPAAQEPPTRGPWLIVADETGVAAELSARLGELPHVVARRGTAFTAEAPGRYVLDPVNPEHVSRLLDEAFPDAGQSGGQNGGLPERVVLLSALDAPAVDAADTAAEAARLAVLGTLHLVRALAERPRGRSPRLFVVARGSQAAGDSTQVTSPQQALAWGFGLAVAQEYPELSTTLIDLPSDGTTDSGIDALWTQLRHADDERLVALRDTGRLVPRLAPTRPDADTDGDGDGDGGSNSKATPIRPDGAYLVTGGLGGLGRVVAERLVRRGVRRLALLSRGTPAPEAARWIAALEQRGVLVHLARADVADRDSLTAALAATRTRLGPIAGVVHAAGVLDDATVPNLTDERVLRVLAPKVLGTALLTELIPEAETLVLFSSVAGLLGSPGQSPYSAANAFLDAWAHHLSRTGRPALSLDWGAWTGVGMVAESDTRAASTSRSGLKGFSPEDGGELFERVLNSTRRQLAPVALDWETLALDPDLIRTRPILGDVVTVSTGDATGSDHLAERVFAATTDQDRAVRLEAYVAARVAEVAGGAAEPSPTTALKQLGLDSLMLVRLRNVFARELGVHLPAEAVFGSADIRTLARTVGEALPERTGPAETSGPAAAPETPAPEVAATELRPATRDVVRLLRTAQQGVPSAAHAIGMAVRLATPTTAEALTAILARLAGRHAALRTAIVTGPQGERQLRVDRDPAGPLLRWTPVDTVVTGALDAGERLRELLEPPFDLTVPALWRFELLDGGHGGDDSNGGGQILVFGGHHAVSDLQSLLLVAAEIDAELSGTPLPGTVTNRDLDLLIEAQQTPPAGAADGQAAAAATAAAEWRAAFEGSSRLDLELSRPRPQTRSFRAGSVTVAIPDGLMERVSERASRLAITPAAFCLGTLTVLLARRRQQERFVLAVPVDTRIHADAYDAVGFFGVPVPFPAQALGDEPVEEVLRRTDGRLNRVLARGAMFSDVLPTLARQGLHRPAAPLVEVYFNFVRAAGGGRLENLAVLPVGTGYSDLDLMITMFPDGRWIRFDHNLDILDAAATAELGEDFVRLLTETVDDPTAPVRPTPPPSPPVGLERGLGLALAATFALGNLPLMCEAALSDGAPGDASVTVAEAPYHQVLASLHDPAGVFADPSAAVGVVLLRATDLERFGPVDDTLLADLRTQYPAALRSLAERTRKPLIVGFPPTAAPDERLARWEQDVADELAETPGIAVLRPGDWTRHHTVEEPFDTGTDRLAHLPFSPPFQAAVALTLAEAVRAVRRPVPKVIAVDGDETLWGGVAGEIGPEAVDLTGPRALLARRLLQWRAAGVLLALVSNNDEATVRAVLDRPDSLLKAEHFSAFSATWGPKSGRLARAARDLNVGVDSFLFLDDNPVEIAGVRAALPEVLSVTCPPASELTEFLGRLWPLVPPAGTAEDSLRAGFYAQERERDAAREENGFEEFLAELKLEVDIREVTEDDVQRAEQLVRRTNQFTMRARSEDGLDVARWRESGEVWTAAARDRFGDYGQIALLAVRRDGDQLDVLAWSMSCRALGRGVEERLLGWLADRAGELGCSKIRLSAERTPRNVPARRLLAALGGGDADDESLGLVATPDHLRTFRSWQQQ